MAECALQTPKIPVVNPFQAFQTAHASIQGSDVPKLFLWSNIWCRLALYQCCGISKPCTLTVFLQLAKQNLTWSKSADKAAIKRVTKDACPLQAPVQTQCFKLQILVSPAQSALARPSTKTLSNFFTPKRSTAFIYS
jgi:hypothetical protein